MQVTTRVIETSRGRLEYFVAGAGPPILYFHGTGAGGDLLFPTEWPIVENGFRLIVPNRPGYGKTPLSSGESARACAGLVAQLLDHLGLDAIAVMGCSGGSAFAAAFARYFPERTSCLVLLCSQLHQWDHPRFLPEQSRWTLSLLKRPWLRRILLAGYRMQVRKMQPIDLLRMQSGSRFEDAKENSDALEKTREILDAMKRDCSEPGLDNDFGIFVREPILVPDTIDCPTLLIHDPCDPNAPLQHVDWAMQCIPHAEYLDVHTAGHLVWAGPDAELMQRRRMSFLREHCPVC